MFFFVMFREVFNVGRKTINELNIKIVNLFFDIQPDLSEVIAC